MKILQRIYKFIFERDCVDYTQPYVCDNINSRFDKYEKYIVPTSTKKSSYISPSYSTNWYNTCNYISTIGYHNSRL